MKDYNKTNKTIHVAAWPSKVVLGTRKNYLKKTCEAFHKFNIKVIGSITFAIPFDMVKVYFHSGQSDWHAISPSPCVISDNFPRRVGNILYKEMVENGVDGVVLGGDEFSCEGHRFTYISPYDPCIKKFKQKYGWDTLPVDAENTLRYRQWEMFEYEGVADLFKCWTDSLRKIKSDIIATCLLCPYPFCSCDRMWSGLACDIIGFKSGMNYMTTDYYRPQTVVKQLIAATPNRKAGYVWRLGVFRPAYLPFKKEIDLAGPLLSVLGQAGKELASLEVYEHRHILTGKPDKIREKGYEMTKQIFYLIKQLQKLGICNSTPPKQVAFLFSRASEDWWQLKNDYIQSRSPTIMRNTWGKEWLKTFSKLITPERTESNKQQLEGYIWNQAVMDLLTAHGIGYDVFYIDQPESLKSLAGYQTLILPFGYAVSKEAVEQIEKAVEQGSNCIIINHKGEVNEMGEPYKIPVLSKLLDNKRVKYLQISLLNLPFRKLSKQIIPLISSKNKNPHFSLNNSTAYGKVFTYFLQSKQKYFVILVNYDTSQHKIKISFPQKLEHLQALDSKQIYKVISKGNKSNGFTYIIPPEKVIVFVGKQAGF